MHFNTSFFTPLGIVTTEESSCLKHVAFSSTNFENILTWETEADIPPGTLFDVQYKQYVKFASFWSAVVLRASVLSERRAKKEKQILLFLLLVLLLQKWFCLDKNSIKDSII